MFYKKESFGMSYIVVIGIVAALMFWLAIAAFGQTNAAVQNKVEKTTAKEKKQTVLQPVTTEYKGIKIGMTADEVRDKLDKKPKVADDDGFYYVFSDEESAQIGLDKKKTVRVILIIYSDKNANAPKYEDVFGKDVPIKETKSGGIYNLIRYPEAGFWVAYNRTAGDNPMVTITIQKMRKAK